WGQGDSFDFHFQIGKEGANFLLADSTDVGIFGVVEAEVVPEDSSAGGQDSHHLGGYGSLYFVVEDGGKERELHYQIEAGIRKGHSGGATADYSQVRREAVGSLDVFV